MNSISTSKLCKLVCLHSILLIAFISPYQAFSQSITSITPDSAGVGDQLDVFISAQNMDFSLGSMSNKYELEIGSRKVVGTYKGTNSSGDTAEVNFNFTNPSTPYGVYDLKVFDAATSNSLSLNEAFKIGNRRLTNISPNKANIGDQLNVFISAENVDFTLGSMSNTYKLEQGNQQVLGAYIGANSSGDTAEVRFDFGNTSLPSGDYDLNVLDLATNSTLILADAFQIGDKALRGATPNIAIIGQELNVLIYGNRVDFSSVSIPPIYTGGGDTVRSTIVGTRGTDTLEIKVSFDSSFLKLGYYDLFLFLPSDTLSLRRAMNLQTTTIRGRFFVDLDSNGVKDANERDFFGKVLLLPDSIVANSYYSWGYTFRVNSGGDYKLVAIPPDSTYITNASDTQLITVNSVDVNQADPFGVNSRNSTWINNLSLNIVGGRARCNSYIRYYLRVTNNGFAASTGTVKFVQDSNLGYWNATRWFVADSIKGDTLYRTFKDIPVGSFRQVSIYCGLPGVTVLSPGARIISSAELLISDASGNAIATKNDEERSIVRCSYDPNDKLVNPKGIGPEGYIPLATPTLEYTIRFQNTGNDTAYRVEILDTLSDLLDYSSFEFEYASHEVVTQLKPNGELSFTFDDIFLVDSMTNEDESNGFVRFRINPISTIPDSTTIINRAGIYFDFNPPIITEYAVSTFVNGSVGIEEIEPFKKGLKVFPNPSSGRIKIVLEETIKQGILNIFNNLGQVVISEENLNGKQFDLDLSQQPKGLYFINISNGNNFWNQKIIVE